MYIVEKVKEVKCFISWTDWQAEGIDETFKIREIFLCVLWNTQIHCVCAIHLCKFFNIYVWNLWDINYQNLESF